MNELKKNDLIRARTLCNIFRFIDDLNSINDGGELESIYSNIYPEELRLGKEENTVKHETSFLDLNIKIKDRSFIFVSLIKEVHFLFLLDLHNKSSNVPSSIVYSVIGAQSLRIARASDNTESFSTPFKPPTAGMIRQGVSIGKQFYSKVF